MNVAVCVAIGYLLGSLNPAALLSKWKHINLREEGTKNLGASNVMLVLGRGYGAAVMLFDILKSFFAAKIAKWLFPALAASQLAAGLGAVLGHVFPFYMKFRGGKGLAAFGGMALAHNPLMFFSLLLLGLILMFIVNYSYVMPMSVAVLFPVLVALESGDLTMFLLAAAAGALIIVKHWSNIGRAKRGGEMTVRQIIREKLLKKEG